MPVELKRKHTLEEYLQIDRTSEARLEYWNGEIFDMSGGSKEHDRIERSVMTHLTTRLSGRGCELFTANMRIKVPSLPPYRYGDLSGRCGEAQFEEIGGVDALINPSLIIEVLSNSTEAYDRGDKFPHYKSVASFAEYLLIAQHRPHISHFTRQDGGLWTHHEYNDLEAVVRLVSLGCELPLREVYENVTFAGSAISSPLPSVE
jgi:Uma2 family endonuclease